MTTLKSLPLETWQFPHSNAYVSSEKHTRSNHACPSSIRNRSITPRHNRNHEYSEALVLYCVMYLVVIHIFFPCFRPASCRNAWLDCWTSSNCSHVWYYHGREQCLVSHSWLRTILLRTCT